MWWVVLFCLFVLLLSFGAYTFFWPFTYISVVMLLTEINSLSYTVPIWGLLTSKVMHAVDHRHIISRQKVYACQKHSCFTRLVVQTVHVLSLLGLFVWTMALWLMLSFCDTQ